jgi:hypothetical protein
MSIPAPDVRHTLTGHSSGATFHVMAYRKLAREEIIQSVAMFLHQNGRKKIKKGSVITIITIHGHSGGF